MALSIQVQYLHEQEAVSTVKNVEKNKPVNHSLVTMGIRPGKVQTGPPELGEEGILWGHRDREATR
jgi:hypothetical protein